MALGILLRSILTERETLYRLGEVVETFAPEGFALSLEELHNDSTTVKFTGQYKEATGRSLRGKKAPFITYGYFKDYRPDLKQGLFILTPTQEGGVSVQFRSKARNQNDSRTHEESWEALCWVVGRRDFLSRTRGVSNPRRRHAPNCFGLQHPRCKTSVPRYSPTRPGSRKGHLRAS